MTHVLNGLRLRYEEIRNTEVRMKSTYYKILEQFTTTPTVIRTEIQKVQDRISMFINETFTELDITPDKEFNVTEDTVETNYEQAERDLEIFIEKYISINYSDSDVFVRDKDAYPIRLRLTDAEYTRIEETTADKEALQCKPAFFDNKKALEYEKSCDVLELCYNRINKRYYGNDPYIVTFTTKGGFGIIMFRQFVEEEDIQNVLSRIKTNYSI